MALCHLFTNVTYSLSMRTVNKVSSSFSDMLRRMTYDKVQNLAVSSMSRKTSGDLLKRITQDTSKVRDFIIERGVYAVRRCAGHKTDHEPRRLFPQRFQGMLHGESSLIAF